MSFKSTPVKTSIGEKALRSEILLPLRIILAFAYGLLVKMRNFLYDNNIVKTRCVATTVFSVGNLSVGGSGKTIVVQALIKHLEDQNKKVCVLSRGYGRQSRGPLLVSNGRKLLETVGRAGDEPYLIAMNYPGTPVLVAEDRYQGARLLEKQFKPDIILLDDGFQHRRLHRDLDVLLIDFPSQPPPHLLPWGRLREPAVSLQRADLLLFSKAGVVNSTQRNSIHLIPEDRLVGANQSRISLAQLSGRIGAFAGIGDPGSFFDTLEQLTGGLFSRLAFRDHQIYGPREQKQIAAMDCDFLITTQKDFIKLDGDFVRQQQIFYLGVTACLPEVVFSTLKHYFK